MTKKSTTGTAVAVGAGLAALAAFAAAGYFLYGKDGAKNRKKVRGWMLKANGRPRWFKLVLPPGLETVTQCDPKGKPKKGGTHWTVKPDRKSVG